MPSQSSDQIVEAALPFRFRLTPNSLGSSGNHGSFGGVHSLLGSHDAKLLSYLYPSSSFNSHRNKRSYADLQCRGIYDPSIFARLERVCEDCYNLYKDDEVHGLCRYTISFSISNILLQVTKLRFDLVLHHNASCALNFYNIGLIASGQTLFGNAFNRCFWGRNRTFTWNWWK